jgi:hypothetical protein
MDPEQIKKTGDLLTEEDPEKQAAYDGRWRGGVRQGWIDRNYHLIMLLAMLVELALLGLLVVLEWMR